ncbi:MAG: hypothetical protein ACJAZ2_002294 [Glaciecola sp.]|jgi:hypothetical protein
MEKVTDYLLQFSIAWTSLGQKQAFLLLDQKKQKSSLAPQKLPASLSKF